MKFKDLVNAGEINEAFKDRVNEEEYEFNNIILL